MKFLFVVVSFRCSSLLLLALLLLEFHQIACKCVIEKTIVRCYGTTWKQDLLPIENDSLESLFISNCSGVSSNFNSIDISFIKSLSKVKSVSLTNCGLEKPPDLHFQIYSVETIDLSHNLINITSSEMGALGVNFFKELPNLKVLNLTHNKLTTLPKVWFDCPSKIETIILDHNLVVGLDQMLASCFQKLKLLSLRFNKFKIVSGVPNTPNTNTETRFLQLKLDKKPNRSKGTFVENNESEIFGIFPPFTTLETLDLSYNEIEKFKWLPFQNLLQLKTLKLRGNRLSRNLSRDCCEFGAGTFYVNSDPGLTSLDLSDNINLLSICKCWTFGLKKLKVLKISNCSIEIITEGSFNKDNEILSELVELDLSLNRLTEIPTQLSASSTTLTRLNLAYNKISEIGSLNLMDFEKLQYLNLSHNTYQSLMVLATKKSESVSSDDPTGLKSVRNDAESIVPTFLLSRMQQLTHLDLSFNQLIKISATKDMPPSIKPQGLLELVDLRGNQKLSVLSDFNADSISASLNKFLLSDEPRIRCTCSISGFVNWAVSMNIEVSGRCSEPSSLKNLPITSNRVINSIKFDKNCNFSKPLESQLLSYRITLASNANSTSNSPMSDDAPFDDNSPRNVNKDKHQDNQYKWVLMGSSIILRCELEFNYHNSVKAVIEWERVKMVVSNEKFSIDSDKRKLYKALKNLDADNADSAKYNKEFEIFTPPYDGKIQIIQIGPLNTVNLSSRVNMTEIQWLKNGNFTYSKGRYKFVSYLILRPASLDDGGRFRCRVNGLPASSIYGQNQIMSKEENIKVFISPTFTATPSNSISIIDGETVEITCRATGYPQPITSLRRVGKEFAAAIGNRITVYRDDSSSFFITNTRVVDDGKYTCMSRNVAGVISFNFTLKVQVRASIIQKKSKKVLLLVRQPLIIKIQATGIPTPTITWYKDDKKINPNDRIKFSSDHLMLVIESTIAEDAGTYKISALNALGGEDVTVSVTILDGPKSPDSNQSTSPKSDSNSTGSKWISDYWLSIIIIMVILSILLTSILWIVVFICFHKCLNSKKRRLLLISNSHSGSSFDKSMTATTNFSNPHNVYRSNALAGCNIPLSLTTSTIVKHDQSREDCHDITDDNNSIILDTNKTCSEFYSPQILRTYYPDVSTSITGGQRFFSQPYLTSSGFNDINSKLQQHFSNNIDAFDSGIDSSQVCSETLNSSEISSIYQCRSNRSRQQQHHELKRHQHNNQTRIRYSNSTAKSNNTADMMKFKEPTSLAIVNCDSVVSINSSNREFELQISNRPSVSTNKNIRSSNTKLDATMIMNCTTPLISKDLFPQ